MSQMMDKAMPQNGLVAMKKLVNSDAMVARARDMLGNEKAARIFLNSALSLYGNDKLLSKCNAADVMQECLKAAALNLPVSKTLGFAYIIPYGTQPQFQLGYRGLVQLAQRSGQYRYINAGAVYEGMTVRTEFMSGMLEISGERTSDEVKGYFAYFELLNGFRKATYWTKAEVEAHAKKYSRAWSQQSSPWHTQFDAMAIKTVLKSILTKYGILSIEMMDTVANDTTADERVEAEVAENANTTPITIPVEMEDNPADEEAGF